MKSLFVTLHRVRNLIKYCEKSDLKDAEEIKENDAISLFQKNGFSEEQAKKFIENVKKNPFNDWIQWK